MSEPLATELIRKRLFVRRLLFGSGLCAVVLAVPAYSQFHNPFHHDTVAIPEGQRFIDLLGVSYPVPDSQKMAMRFRPGEHLDPRDATTVNDPVLDPYINNVAQITTKLLASYDKGPKPRTIQFRVIDAADINCAIVAINPEQYSNSLTQVSNAVFNADGTAQGAQTAQAAVAKAKQGAQARPAAPATSSAAVDPNALPSPIELQCTAEALKQVTGEGEMPFLIAHELSHILLGHWDRYDVEIQRQKKIQNLMDTGLMITALVNSDYRVTQQGVEATPRAEYAKTAGKVMMSAFLMNEYNLVVRSPNWQRDQERQADLLALDLLYKAKMPRDGGVTVMEKMDAAEQALKKTDSPYFESLFGSSAGMLLMSYRENNSNMMRAFRMAGVNVVRGLYGKWRQIRMTKSHDDSKRRAVVIDDYINAHDYAPTPQNVVSTPETRFLTQNKFATVLAPLDNIRIVGNAINSDASCQALTPKAQTALKTIQANKNRMQNENYVLAAYNVCLGNWKTALPYAQSAAGGRAKNAIYFGQLIAIQQELGQHTGALATIARAETQAPPPDQYVLLKIKSTVALKRPKEADKMARDCAKTEPETLGEQCMALIGLTLDGKPLKTGNVKAGSGVDAGGLLQHLLPFGLGEMASRDNDDDDDTGASSSSRGFIGGLVDKLPSGMKHKASSSSSSSSSKRK